MECGDRTGYRQTVAAVLVEVQLQLHRASPTLLPLSSPIWWEAFSDPCAHVLVLRLMYSPSSPTSELVLTWAPQPRDTRYPFLWCHPALLPSEAVHLSPPPPLFDIGHYLRVASKFFEVSFRRSRNIQEARHYIRISCKLHWKRSIYSVCEIVQLSPTQGNWEAI